MTPSITALSLEPVASEREFLHRELGVTWEITTPAAITSAARPSHPILLGISEAGSYQELLRELPARSVVLMMLSDEGYSKDRLDLVRESPSVRAVYRHYSVQSASWAAVAAEARRFVAGARAAQLPSRLIVELLRTGRETRERMMKWGEVQVPVNVLPLGYTNTFAVEFTEHFDLRESSSLFEFAETDTTAIKGTALRTTGVFFRGAPGQPQRRVMLAKAAGRSKASIQLVDNTWQGSPIANAEYVDGLLNSTHALCPPGWVNTETFRYYEALICGAIPIEPETALTHRGIAPHRGPQPLARVRLALRSAHQAMRRDLEVA